MIERHLRCNPRHAQCSRYHAELVDDYRRERYRQEIEREGHCSDYAIEIVEYNRSHNMITFKQWLQGTRSPVYS